MAKRKFSRKAFRGWLDCIAKLTCKTDDSFTCQMQLSDNCSGTMMALDFDCQWCHIKSKKSYNLRWLAENAITGCGSCHAYAHDNPDEFIRWFTEKYPHRIAIIDKYNRMPSRTWRQLDFEILEKELLQDALAVGVDYLNAPIMNRWRNRLKRKLEELR